MNVELVYCELRVVNMEAKAAIEAELAFQFKGAGLQVCLWAGVAAGAAEDSV